MKPENKIWAILPSGGIGLRMGADKPKQYLKISGKPIIHHTLSRICSNASIDGIIVGIRENDQYWRQYPYCHAKLLGKYPAGRERMDTVLNGLHFLMENTNAAEDDWAMIHDGARPCIMQRDIDKVIDESRRNRIGAVLGGFLSETLKQSNAKNEVISTVNRDGLWRAFTPQIFRIRDLISGLQKSKEKGIAVTDESMAMEMIGFQPRLVEGHPSNIKMTVDVDLALLKIYLKRFQ